MAADEISNVQWQTKLDGKMKTNSKSERIVKHRRWLWVLLGIAVLPFLFACALLIWLVARDAIAKVRLTKTLDELKATNKPIDNDSLQAYYSQRTSETGAKEWIQVLDYLSSPEYVKLSDKLPIVGSASDTPIIGQPWSGEVDANAFMEQHRPLYDLMVASLQGTEPVRFPVKFDSLETQTPYTEASRYAVRLMMLECLLAMRRNDAVATSKAIIAIHQANRILAGEPTIVSQLVRLSFKSFALRELRTALLNDMLEPEHLNLMLEICQKGRGIDDRWQYALDGETALALPALFDPSYLEKLCEGKLPKLPLRNNDILTYVNIMQAAKSIPTGDLDIFLQRSKIVQRNIERRFQGSTFAWLDTMLSSIVTQPIELLCVEHIRDSLQHRLATLAVAIRLYAHMHGKHPDGLEELVAIGIDCKLFSSVGGMPFGYSKSDDHAVVWGIDPRVENAVPGNPTPTAIDGEDNLWYWRIRTK